MHSHVYAFLLGSNLGLYACHTSGLPLSNVCYPVLIFIYSFLIASTVVPLSISIPKFSVTSKTKNKKQQQQQQQKTNKQTTAELQIVKKTL